MTSTIALICEKWTMELPHTGRDEWFADWVIRSPKHAGVHLTAGYRALESLTDVYTVDQISSVREYFGGIGAQALIVEEMFGPFRNENISDAHLVREFNHEAVTHLGRVSDGRFLVEWGDAYDPSSCVPADLVMLDFGDLTAWKTRDGEPHRKLLDRVFAHRPKAVVLTDIACRYLHLHRERYESLLGAGTCESYESYLYALVGRLEALYGYTLLEGYMDRWSTVMALVPEVLVERGRLQETPSSPVGIELF